MNLKRIHLRQGSLSTRTI